MYCLGTSKGVATELDTMSAFNGAAFEIPYYTGKIFPTPQKVVYSDEFIPLTKVGIMLGKGISKENPRVMMLKKRIADKGGTAEVISSFSRNYETILALGDTDLGRTLLKKGMLPEKKEGYCIYPVRKDKTTVIILQGHDLLGLTWAVVSFNQLVTENGNAPVFRKAEVHDFPAVAITRGQQCDSWWGSESRYAWFTVQSKVNMVTFAGKLVAAKGENWREEVPANLKKELNTIGDLLNPLGIEWSVCISPNVCRPERKIRSKNEEDFAAVFNKASLIASAGGNISIEYDDMRFPITAEDKKDFGSAREADIYFLNKLYSELKKRYPEVKLEFLPPFYWGPKYDPNFPEGRDEYLAALGSRLSPEIKVTWAGHSVCSTDISRKDVEWSTNILKRKPSFYQNGAGAPHYAGYHYVTDPLTGWKNWYYEGFFNDIDSYRLNQNAPLYCTALLTLSARLWNPGAYDAEQVVEDAAKKVAGPEAWPWLVELNKVLSWLERYECNVSPVAAKNVNEIKQKVGELDAAWKKVTACHPEAVKTWTSLETHVKQQKGFLAKLERPDLSAFANNLEVVKALAVKEAGLTSSDIFLSPYDFIGGGAAKEYFFECEKRLATWVFGARSGKNKMSAGFDLSIPPVSDYSLVISGQDDEAPAKCRIRITVNNNKVFEGENPFVQYGWSLHTFTVKAAFLKEGSNAVSIENIEDSDGFMGPPFFMLNYMVVRMFE